MNDQRTHAERALHPTQGVRLLFERRSIDVDDAQARYRAVIFTPDERFEYQATLTLSGDYALTADGSPASSEYEDKLAVVAKLIARGSGRRRSDGLPPWPHRVLRWRGPKR